MRVRSLCVSALVLLLLAPGTALAASSKPQPKKTSVPAWRTFSSTHLGISFRYPGVWRLSPQSSTPNSNQVTASYVGKGYYSLTILLMPFNASPTLSESLTHFINVQIASTRSKTYGTMTWSATKVGNNPARAGVISPPTEGGVAISTGIYVTQSRSRLFEITVMSYHKPPVRSLDKFPPIYRQVLSTFRFS